MEFISNFYVILWLPKFQGTRRAVRFVEVFFISSPLAPCHPWPVAGHQAAALLPPSLSPHSRHHCPLLQGQKVVLSPPPVLEQQGSWIKWMLLKLFNSVTLSHTTRKRILNPSHLYKCLQSNIESILDLHCTDPNFYQTSSQVIQPPLHRALFPSNDVIPISRCGGELGT